MNNTQKRNGRHKHKHKQVLHRSKSKFIEYSNEKAPIVTKRRKTNVAEDYGDDDHAENGDNDAEIKTKGLSKHISNQPQSLQAQGMSRAAKKRLKKQQQQQQLKTSATASPSSSSSSSSSTLVATQKALKLIPHNDNDDDNSGEDDNDDNLQGFYYGIDMAEDDNGQDEDDSEVNDEDKDEGLYEETRLNSDKFHREVHSVPEWVRHLLGGKVMTYDSLINILSLEEVSEITSQLRANFILQWILAMDINEFYQNMWGKSPCHCKSTDRDTDAGRFQKLFSRNSINNILQEHLNIYGVDVELLLYNDGGDKTFNKLSANGKEVSDADDKLTAGSIVPAKKLWEKHDKAGAILNLLCPQKYHDIIWRMNSALEHEFGSLVLGQVLLYPSKGDSRIPAQYRKFDTFILQVEGECKVEVYKPLPADKRETNSRTVFILNESLDDPYMCVTMTAGDVLYVPIGWGYGQVCKDGNRGIQYNITTNIMNSRIDILESLLPHALSVINERGEKFAMKCLPSNFGSIMGVSTIENDEMSEECKVARSDMFGSVNKLMQDVTRHALESLDAASDQHMKTFIMNRLPIPLSPAEEKRSSAGAKDLKMFPFTKLRLIRPGIARVLLEDGMVVVYHCMDNSREQSSGSNASIKPLEYDVDDGPAIERLLKAYPNSIEVNSLPHPSEELDDKIGIAQSLFNEGILYVTDEATLPFDDEGGDNDDDDCPF